jgi:membrane associated rhomboid family serine protease
VSSPDTEVDGSVCYRHPDRTSWTLCQRCGRTICPECQILTPGGVRCPDCVREAGGSVRWEPAAGAKPPRAKKTGLRGAAPRSPLVARAAASTRPIVTIGIGAVALVLWLAGFATANAPFVFLAALPDVAAQVWRYVTAAFVYPSFGGPAVVSTVLGLVIFVYIGWNVERRFSRSRFIGLFLVTGAGAAAISLLAGGAAWGLTGPIWGLVGALLISVWGEPAVRNRLLITFAIWFVISLFLSGNILTLIGGALSGIGAALLFRRYDDRPRSRPSTPYLILAGVIAVIIVLAILRSTMVPA